MSLIDDISEIREHNRRYGWFGADHPAVLRMACALENGSLSALDAKLARILISESVRPDADFSGAVAALSPMFWARGNIDLPESATLGDWEAGKWIADRRREITAGTTDLSDLQVELLTAMNIFGPPDFSGVAVGASGHRVAVAQDYVIAGVHAEDRTSLAVTIAFQLVVRGAHGPVAYVGTGDTYGLNDAFEVFGSVPDVWPESGVIVCDGLDAEQAKACRSRAFGTGAVLIEASEIVRRPSRRPGDIIVLPLSLSVAEQTFDSDTLRVLEGGGISQRPAMEIRPDGQRVFFDLG